MTSVENLKNRIGKLDNQDQTISHEQVDEIYLVGLVPAGAKRPTADDSRLLLWRRSDDIE